MEKLKKLWLYDHAVIDEPEVSALADEAISAASRLYNHLLDRHPALIQAVNRDGVDVLRVLAVRWNYTEGNITIEQEPGDRALSKRRLRTVLKACVGALAGKVEMSTPRAAARSRRLTFPARSTDYLLGRSVS